MFTLRIVTPRGNHREMEVDRVSLPTTDGIVTMLPNHMDMMTPVEFGIVKTIVDKKVTRLVISDGLFTFKDNVGVLLVDLCEDSKDIDYVRAENSKKRAEERLASKESMLDLERAEYSLKRSLIRLSMKED